MIKSSSSAIASTRAVLMRSKTSYAMNSVRAVSTTGTTTAPAQTPLRHKSTAAALSEEYEITALDEFNPWIRRETMHTGSTLVQAMLPHERSPTLLTRTLRTPNGPIRISIGAAVKLSAERPGNGGFRLLCYDSDEGMAEECIGLAQGMEIKHAMYNTGFAGAKVVCDASRLEGGVGAIDRKMLMTETSALLRELEGVMFTGCDMNTTLEDMESLATQCDYVLAAIGNRDIDPNVCTAAGVVGALEAVLCINVDDDAYGKRGESLFPAAGKTLVVHGCGNVGAGVAEAMAKFGAKVYTLDLDPARADIPGCINLSRSGDKLDDGTPWWSIPCDAIVPCSKSSLFTEEIAAELDTRAIVGATNLPFATDEAYCIATSKRGVAFIPEGVSSAGAVIADSVEHFDAAGFAESTPSRMYEFVRDTVRSKTSSLLVASGREKASPVETIARSIALTDKSGNIPPPLEMDETPVGVRFAEHKESHLSLSVPLPFQSEGKDERCNGETDSMGINDNDNNNDYEKNVGIKSNSSNVLNYNMSVLSGGLKRVQSFMNASRAFSTTAASSVAKVVVEEADGKHTPFGKEGSGFYSEATKGCYDVIANAAPIVFDALERALDARKASGAAQRHESFTIADFGTADAGTSMPLLCKVVERVREAEGEETPIVVAYEDQTTNDWNSVFKRVHGVLPGADRSYLSPESGLSNVFAMAVGTSFYAPCFPKGTVDLSFSATAMHWLSSVPSNIPDALHSACSTDEAVTAAFDLQAAKDWEHIMSLREQELKPGGQLVVVNFAKDEDGYFLGHSHRMSASMHHTFAELWSELVTPTEFEATNFPNQYRSLDAQCAPFQGSSSSSSSGKVGMTLVSAETMHVPCPYYDGFVESKETYAFAGDAVGHAQNYIPTTRTWSNSTFLAGLHSRSSQEEKDAIVEEMFQRYAERVAAAPEDHAMDYVHAYLHAEKPRV